MEYFDSAFESLNIHLGVLSNLSKHIISQKQDSFSIKNLMGDLIMQLQQLNITSRVEK